MVCSLGALRVIEWNYVTFEEVLTIANEHDSEKRLLVERRVSQYCQQM